MVSRNVGTREIFYRIHQRWYLMPIMLNKMFPSKGDECRICKEIRADFFPFRVVM